MQKEIVSQDDIIMDIHNYCIYDLKRLVFPFAITLLWTIALIIIALFLIKCDYKKWLFELAKKLKELGVKEYTIQQCYNIGSSKEFNQYLDKETKRQAVIKELRHNVATCIFKTLCFIKSYDKVAATVLTTLECSNNNVVCVSVKEAILLRKSALMISFRNSNNIIIEKMSLFNYITCLSLA